VRQRAPDERGGENDAIQGTGIHVANRTPAGVNFATQTRFATY
jgi:hypothetical protein